MNGWGEGPPPGGERGPFTSDLADMPLVRIQAPSASLYRAVDVPSFFAGIDAALAREVSVAGLLDARDVPPVSMEQRIEFVGMVNARRDVLRSYVAAFGVVVASPFERGLVTAFAWFSNPPLPVRLFEAPDEAEVWLRQRLSVFDGSTGPGRGPGGGPTAP